MKRRTLKNRKLPLWLHRLSNGVLGAALAVTIAGIGFANLSPDQVLYLVCTILLYLSIPLGVVAAVVTPRFSLIDDLFQMGNPEKSDE